MFICWQNGDAVAFRNGNVKILPDTNTVTSVVTIEYETREGTAKHGKDFKYVSDKLVTLSLTSFLYKLK